MKVLQFSSEKGVVGEEGAWCPDGMKRLAKAAIASAVGDLNSRSYRDQDSAIRFFDKEEPLHLLCALVGVHPSHIELPEYSRIPEPKLKGRGSIRALQEYDLYKDFAYIGTTLGVTASSRALGASSNTTQGLLDSGMFDHYGRAIVPHGAEPKERVPKYDVYKDGEKVTECASFREVAYVISSRPAIVQILLESGKRSNSGYYVVEHGAEPPKRKPSDSRVTIIDCYKDGKFQFTSEGYKETGRRVGASSGTVRSALLSGKPLRTGWRFKRRHQLKKKA